MVSYSLVVVLSIVLLDFLQHWIWYLLCGISSPALPAPFCIPLSYSNGGFCIFHLHELFGYFGWRWSRFAALRLCNYSNRLCYILWTNFDYKLCNLCVAWRGLSLLRIFHWDGIIQIIVDKYFTNLSSIIRCRYWSRRRFSMSPLAKLLGIILFWQNSTMGGAWQLWLSYFV